MKGLRATHRADQRPLVSGGERIHLPFPIRFLAVPVLAGLFGCDPGTNAPDSPAGGVSVADATELQWAVEENLAGVWGQVVDADVDECGRIWVADGFTQSISIHAESVQRFEIGRKGSGPGEFQAIRSIRLAKDTAFVLDSSNQRLSIWAAPCDREPYLASTVPLFWEGHTRAAGNIGRTEDGDFLVTTRSPMLVGAEAPDPVAALERVTLEGLRPLPPLISVPGYEVLTFSVGDGGISGPMPFGSEPILRVMNGRQLVAGSTSSPQLTFYDMQGSVTDSLILPLPTHRVSPEDVTHFINTMRADGSFALLAPFPLGAVARVEAAAAEGRLPEFHPVFRTLEVDDELQWLWLQIPGEQDRFEFKDPGPSRYTNSEGTTKFLGIRLSSGEYFRVTTLGRRSLLRARGGKLLTLIENELGVQSLEVIAVGVTSP